jgi:integrase
MPYLNHTPTFRLHKPTGQAVVTIDGKDIYLGPHGQPSSREAYNRIVGEWFANGRQIPPPAVAALTVGALAVQYITHADAYYRKADGTPTTEATAIRQALKPLNRLYARVPAADFGPLKLKAVRQAMIDLGWARTNINRQVSRIRQMFKWAASNELVPGSLSHALAAVSGLHQGRSEAKEPERVKPVPAWAVDAITPHLPPTVAAMIQIQRLTGMRPGEVCAMRPVDIDTTGAVWIYRPQDHKTFHHGHTREIIMGPRAIDVVKKFLTRLPHAFLFSPAESEAERAAQRRAERKTPMTPSQAKRTPKTARNRAPAQRYTVPSYRRAITRACDAAGVPRWHPHQLRHNAATELRAKYGIEAARVILGHRSAAITEVYAEQDRGAAVRIMAEVG